MIFIYVAQLNQLYHFCGGHICSKFRLGTFLNFRPPRHPKYAPHSVRVRVRVHVRVRVRGGGGVREEGE